jgi:hypothetical protein
MNQNCRNTSLSSALVIVILLCSIVCSSTSVFGRVIPAQITKVYKKEAANSRFSAQLAEQVGTETEEDSKHETPLFIMETAKQLFRTIIATPGSSALVYTTRIDSHRNIVPLYLVERTIRI